jgi:iron complex transport system substrate-binding protein
VASGLLSLLLGIGLGSLCSSARAAAQQQNKIQDMTGRQVTLPVNLQRIATNGGVLEEWILMLGGENKLVATSVSNQTNPWFLKLFPAIKKIPAPFQPKGDVNLEALISTRPEAVLMLSGLTTQESIENARLPVVVFERTDAKTIKQSILLLGNLLGQVQEARARQFCTFYDATIQRVGARTGALAAKNQVKVYYVASGDPLDTDGADTMAATWVAQAGGVNVAARAGVKGMNKKVTFEEIARWNPDVIISSTRVAADEIQRSAQWRQIPAVRKQRVYVNPKCLYLWARNSTETAMQTLWAAKMLHPELFADVSMEKETRGFYQTFFRYRMSDAELQSILNPAH